MKFDPQKHHRPFDAAQGRRSIRLQGYDYTQSGAYFITIVTYHREPLFGGIVNGEMQLSAMGRIADEHWRAIPEHFPNVELGAYVVMPNHVHGIIINNGSRGTIYRAPTEQFQKPVTGSIPTIIRTYKASVTRRIQKEVYGLDVSSPNVWQRNYYEHIIRSDEDHHRIHLYIESNIDNWVNDEENPINVK
jgi:REP element-mobilizing transposase RayT